MKILSILSGFCIFVIAIALYAGTIRGVSGDIKASDIKNKLDQATKPLELSPERGRFILTMSLAQNKSFALSRDLGMAAYPDVGYYQGRLYVYFAPGISVMALPFYWIGKQYNISQVASFFMISIFAILTLLLLYKIARNVFKLPLWTSMLISLIFGFGCTSWSYAITMYQHHVTTFFIVSGFYAVWKFRQKSRLSWYYAAWTWFAYGAAIFIDYPNAFLMAPVMIYFAISAVDISAIKDRITITPRWSAIITAVFFVILVAVHGYYNAVNFGGWTHVSGSLVGYKDILEKQLLVKKTGSKTIQKLAESKDAVGFFKEDHLPSSNTTLLFSEDRGLFLYAPIFILGFLGLWSLRKKINPEIATLLGVIGCNVFLYSSWGDPWGGWAYGPRYLIPSMAVLSLFIGVWVTNGKFGWLRRIVTFLFLVYTVAIAILGALTTNSVPPKVEGDYLHTGHNFLLNLKYLQKGESSSFVYNTYLFHKISLIQYFEILYIFVMAIFLVVLFILPLIKAYAYTDKS